MTEIDEETKDEVIIEIFPVNHYTIICEPNIHGMGKLTDCINNLKMKNLETKIH